MQKDKKKPKWNYLIAEMISFKAHERALLGTMLLSGKNFLCDKAGKWDDIELQIKYRIIKKK